ncbi:MAG: MaoC/PaaZ C-terminal domain-containing protein [Pseudomonadota bacterium]
MSKQPIEFICPVINRVDIAWLCVATDDPNPLHLDINFAREKAGYQDVVVPGTLMVGWIGEYLEEYSGAPENVLDWRIRFTAPVWPGEQIKLTGNVLEEIGERVKLEVIASTMEGRQVAKVSACLKTV